MIPGTMALVRPGPLLLLLTTISASHLRAQTGWAPMQTPGGGRGVHFYDPSLRRTIYFDQSGTYSYDGNSSGQWIFLASNRPPPPGAVFCGGGYDHTSRNIVYYDGGSTWELNGSAWVVAARFPPIWSFMGFTSHAGRGTVMAFGGQNNRTSNDLYEWDGTTWNLLPTTGRPPRAMSGLCDGVMYRTMAYDARRDKLVVFGSATYDWCNGVLSNFQPDLWEWDAANGWVQQFVQQGRIELEAQLFFDSQRGVLTLVSGSPSVVRVAEWDGGNSWRPITPVNPIPSNARGLSTFGSYDEARGRYYTGLWLSNLNGYRAYSYGTVAPAEFEPQQPGCAGTLGEPELRLTHNWTRAWLGRSLSVDLANLPMSSGIVALGWSDQQHGSTPLPLDLTPFGMPGCSARVAPDSVYFVAGSNQTATLSLPVPANASLLGGVFFQQGYAFDPGANPLGLSTSGSVRLTIGSL